MSTQQAYIEGFVKRAVEYGLNKNEAIKILKQANALNIAPKQDPMVIAPTPGAPSHIPPYQPKYHEPVQIDPISPEINEQLTGVSPSSMTPKNHWEAQLSEIMAKKPVLAAQKVLANAGGPTQLDIANNHADDIYNAIQKNIDYYRKQSTGGIKGIFNRLANKIRPPTPDPNIGYVDRIQNHFKKYDPSWGDDIRLPLPKNPAGNQDFLKYYQNNTNGFIPSSLKYMNYWKNKQK